jgi:hypothetical protein
MEKVRARVRVKLRQDEGQNPNDKKHTEVRSVALDRQGN